MRRNLSVLVLVGGVVLGGCASAGAASAAGGTQREAIGSRPQVPYSEAVRVGETYYFSGKIGATEQTRAMSQGRAAAETRNVLEAFRQTLDRLGLSLADVVSANVYLDDMADYAEMNRVYSEFFPSDAPARVTVGVEALPAGAAVEISLIAVARAPR